MGWEGDGDGSATYVSWSSGACGLIRSVMDAGAAGSHTESRQDSSALSDVVNRGRAPVGIWRCESMTRSWRDATGLSARAEKRVSNQHRGP